ncbi:MULTISPECIES: hypothetical protein [Clostridium]|uniref:hypothetical protein n=1 Tax=Clostridium TaxID=1485 RepID=UPI00082629C4|nr:MULTISPECIES: hypothetical protein [Clostridium]PJI09592.1 hypothetical protein CUB90_17720 [Clostridium sp. CT7]
MKKNKILCAILVLLIVVISSGCSKSWKWKTTHVVIKEQEALEYLQKKYGKKFVCEGYCKSGRSRDTSKMIIHPKDDKTKRFTILKEYSPTYVEENGRDVRKDGYSYEDDYPSKLIEPMIDKRIKNTVGSQFPDVKYASYISDCGNINNDYKDKIDYDNFIKQEGETSDIKITVLVNYGDNFDKNKAAQKAYSFMKKVIDGKLVNTPIKIKASFYFVDSGNYNKDNIKSVRWDENDISGEYVDIHEKYNIKYSVDLESEDGLNYSQDIRDIENKMDSF